MKICDLPENSSLTDPYTFFNGEKVITATDWEKRIQELSELYQYYMYGAIPDTSGEVISYQTAGNKLTITITKGTKSVAFTADYSLPDQSIPIPEGGYPVLIAFRNLEQIAYANNHGYATIVLDTECIAVDRTPREGIFYELYPYGEHASQQTGALLAWGWGVSKILDALSLGAADELHINTDNNILTGVSRWGKATLAAGAFDKRIKVIAPSCSGAGGAACFRYKSEGKVYDYSGIGVTAPYKTGVNEPLSCLQSTDLNHWFNDKFLEFKTVNALPFDQHLLATLCARKDRFLFLTCSYLNEDWINAPGMWVTYLAAKKIYKELGLEDNITMFIHKEGHKVTDEDMIYLLDYCDYHFYGKKAQSDLSVLGTSLFMETANYDPFFDQFLK